MSASTCVLVEMGEEDPIISVAQLVAGLIGDADGKVVKECESLLEAGKFTEVVSKIMAHGGKLFADAPEKDLEAAVLIIGGLAQRLSPADAAKCVDQLVAAALAGTDRGSLRAATLFQLYNMTTDAKARFPILKKILAYVREAKLAELVAPISHHVEDNYKSWNLDAAETRAVLSEVLTMLAETSGNPDPNSTEAKRILDLQLQFLSTFASGDKLDAKGEEVAKAVVTAFVKATDMTFRCDLLGSPAVQALEGTKSSGALKLLTTMLTGNGVADFTAFAKSNGAVFKDLGLEEAECMGKMKLLTLCALAEKSAEGEFTYAQVAEALQCGEGEVESWIVRAVGARLVEAKMDQVRGVAVVTRVNHRVFGDDQWKDLKTKLASWRENLEAVANMSAPQAFEA